MKLTQKIIAELPYSDKQVDIKDDKELGLFLRTSKTKKIWRLIYRIPGANTLIRRNIAPWGMTAMTVDEARKEAQKLKTYIVEHGEAPKTTAEKFKEKQSPTVRDIFLLYTTCDGEKKPPIEIMYKIPDTARNNILLFEPDFFDMKVKDIRHKDISYWRNLHLSTHIPRPNTKLNKEYVKKPTRERTKPPTASSVNKWVSSLSKMFTWATKMELIEKNPIKGLERLSEIDTSANVNFLKKDEIKRLLHVAKVRNDWWYPAIMLATNTGIRAGGICNLKWKDIDWINNTIFLPPEYAKNQHGAHLPMNATLRNALLDWQRVCENNGKGNTEDKIIPVKAIPQYKWKQILKKALINEAFRWQDLRHTYASYLAMANVGGRVISELLTHKDPTLVKRYAHISNEVQQVAAAKLNNIFGDREENNEEH